MPDKVKFPQVPSTVWWGVRSILQRTPTITIDERLLGVQLKVQETAAKTYVNELKAIGLLTEEGKASEVGSKWRLDQSYPEAVTQLIKAIYPESLLHIAPPGDADRQKVVDWFMREGLGQGTAGNKAATYLLICSPVPNEAPTRSSSKVNREDPPKRAPSPKKVPLAVVEPPPAETQLRERINGRSPETFPLNINVQIHISADAGAEQIESIFSAMRRNLYDSAPS